MRALLLTFLALVACAESHRPCLELHQSCESSAECPSGATCEDETWAYGSASTCQSGCDSELDCPRSGGFEGRCLDVSRTGTFSCYRGCASDSDCPASWVCQPIRSSGVVSAICLP